jgi:hypothetical protein
MEFATERPAMVSSPADEAKATARSPTASVPNCSVTNVIVSFYVSFFAAVPGVTEFIADWIRVFSFDESLFSTTLACPWASGFPAFFFAGVAADFDFLTEFSLVTLTSHIWRTSMRLLSLGLLTV